jgi:hypothetical protein
LRSINKQRKPTMRYDNTFNYKFNCNEYITTSLEAIIAAKQANSAKSDSPSEEGDSALPTEISATTPSASPGPATPYAKYDAYLRQRADLNWLQHNLREPEKTWLAFHSVDTGIHNGSSGQTLIRAQDAGFGWQRKARARPQAKPLQKGRKCACGYEICACGAAEKPAGRMQRVIVQDAWWKKYASFRDLLQMEDPEAAIARLPHDTPDEIKMCELARQMLDEVRNR